MKSYLNHITADSFSGIVFALEGMKNTIVLVNGPTGCKFYHSATSDYQSVRQMEFDPLKFPEELYFGQPRVPCTYLDSRDYVYGSEEKLKEAFTFLEEQAKFDFICIINSPGAALIGDDLRRVAASTLKHTPFMVMETPGYSKSAAEGHEMAAIATVAQLTVSATATKTRSADSRPKVNILGLSLFHRYYEGDKAELERLFACCDIEIGCMLCAGSSMDEVKDIGNADLNLVIYPEYGAKTAEYLKERFGTAYYLCDGPPIGFKAVETMMREVCEILHTSCDSFMEESRQARARAYVMISRLNSLTGLPKGVLYAVEGTYSQCYAYQKYLTGYFGMAADCLSIHDRDCDIWANKLKQQLEECRMESSLHKEITETRAELVFGTGNTIAVLKLKQLEFSGIETALPSMGYVDVIPKTHLGLQGALLLTEQVINGVMFR